MSDLIAKVQQLAELIGPNVYLQGIIIAAIFIMAGKIADWIVSGIIGRIASRSTNKLDDQFVNLVHRPIFLSFVLLGLGLAAQHMIPEGTSLTATIGILKTIAIIVWYGTLNRLLALLVQLIRRDRRNAIAQTGMLPLFHNAMKIILVVLAGYFIMVSWKVDVTPLLASAGIVGLALSFAAKDSLSNLFAGVSIVMDAPYKVGDFIILDSGERGIVTMIGLRSTRLLTRDDVEITVPNGIIGNGKIINEAGGPSERHRIRVAVGVAYGSDIDKVIATLDAVAAEHAEVCSDPAPRVRFRQFGDSSLDFELLCWIDRPIDRGRMQHELLCAVYKAFGKNDIEIPFPQRDLHVRSMPQSAST